MSRKRLPSELSVEELLKSLDTTPESVEKEVLPEDYKNDILGFLHFFKIESGNHYISTRLLYQIYKQWSKTPLKQRDFSYELGKYLDRTHTMGYRINQKGIHLSASAFKYYAENRAVRRTQSAHYHRHFTNFLTKFDLKAGKTWVPWFAIYHLYDKWTYSNHTKNYLSEDLFQSFLRVFFKQKRKNIKNTQYVYYGVTSNFYNYVTPEQIKSIIEARLNREKTYKKNSKRKDEIQARTDEISGTKSSRELRHSVRRTYRHRLSRSAKRKGKEVVE